jgi:hypothetical protein
MKVGSGVGLYGREYASRVLSEFAALGGSTLSARIVPCLGIEHRANNVDSRARARPRSRWGYVRKALAAPSAISVFLAVPHRHVSVVHDGAGLALTAATATDDDGSHAANLKRPDHRRQPLWVVGCDQIRSSLVLSLLRAWPTETQWKGCDGRPGNARVRSTARRGAVAGNGLCEAVVEISGLPQWGQTVV